jgi:hypothetical protein
MKLLATFEVTRVAAGIDDVELVLELENNGLLSVVVYPEVAQWSARAGWAGPAFGLEGMRELRTWYGPPGHPPNSSYFDQGAKPLARGQRLATRFHACLFAPGVLEPRHLALATLDPEGMDGLSGLDLASSSLLVVGPPAKLLLAEREKREDFLRPGLFVPLAPKGPWPLRFSYHQEENSFYKPKKALWLNAEATLAAS